MVEQEAVNFKVASSSLAPGVERLFIKLSNWLQVRYCESNPAKRASDLRSLETNIISSETLCYSDFLC